MKGLQRSNDRLKNGPLKQHLEIGEYLVRDPKIYHGELTFKGTRVPVSVVLAYIAKGISMANIKCYQLVEVKLRVLAWPKK